MCDIRATVDAASGKSAGYNGLVFFYFLKGERGGFRGAMVCRDVDALAARYLCMHVGQSVGQHLAAPGRGAGNPSSRPLRRGESQCAQTFPLTALNGHSRYGARTGEVIGDRSGKAFSRPSAIAMPVIKEQRPGAAMEEMLK